MKETNVTALVPVINLSEGATITPASDVATDFTTAVTYMVTAEDGVITQDWTVTVYLDPAVKVEMEKANPSIFIYPNPATDKMVVEMWKSGDIYLIDLVGQVVRTVNNASTKTTIPLSGLKRGIYFLRVEIDHSNQVSKVILE